MGPPPRKKAKSTSTAPKDFVKKKHKIGKRVVSEEERTAKYSVKALHVPTQVIATLKPGEDPLSHKRHTLHDLLGLASHYSVNVRKDTVLEFRELFSKHPAYCQPHLAAVMQRVCPLLTDIEHDVRKPLLTFLSWLLEKISPAVLRSSYHLLAVHTCSALTHLSPSVQKHACELVRLIAQHQPSLLGMHACQILPCLSETAAQLCAKVSSSIKEAEKFGLLAVMDTMLSTLFPTSALSTPVTAHSASDSTQWHVGFSHSLHPLQEENGSSSSPSATLQLQLDPSSHLPPLICVFRNTEGRRLAFSQGTVSSSSTDVEPSVVFAQHTSRILSTALSMWLELVTSEAPSSVSHLKNTAQVLSLLSTLFARMEHFSLGLQVSEYESLVRHVTNALPLPRHPKLEKEHPGSILEAEAIMLLCCTRLLHSSGSQPDKLTQTLVEWGPLERTTHELTGRLIDNFRALLHDAATLGLSQKEISGRILETFPLLLSRMPKTGHHLAALWDSMTEWHGRLPVTSPFKMQGLSLFAHMAKLKSDLSPSEDTCRQWLVIVPRLLWELKNSDLVFSEFMLRTLLEFSRLPGGGLVAELADHLVPLFVASVPTGRSKSRKHNQQVDTPAARKKIFGPFCSYPSTHLQLLLLDLLHALPTLSSPLLSSLLDCCCQSDRILPDTVLTHAVEVVLDRRLTPRPPVLWLPDEVEDIAEELLERVPPAMPSPDSVSEALHFGLSLLLGRQYSSEIGSRKRRAEVVDSEEEQKEQEQESALRLQVNQEAVAYCFSAQLRAHGIRDAGTLLRLLLPAMESMWKDRHWTDLSTMERQGWVLLMGILLKGAWKDRESLSLFPKSILTSMGPLFFHGLAQLYRTPLSRRPTERRVVADLRSRLSFGTEALWLGAQLLPDILVWQSVQVCCEQDQDLEEALRCCVVLCREERVRTMVARPQSVHTMQTLVEKVQHSASGRAHLSFLLSELQTELKALE